MPFLSPSVRLSPTNPQRVGTGPHAALRMVVVGLVLTVACTAAASPWTLPEGTVAVSIGTDLQTARKEFVRVGTDERFQNYPLNGRYSGANLRAVVRYGLSDSFEIGVGLTAGRVAFNGDEIYLGDIFDPTFGEDGSVERFRANILSVDRDAFGLGDVRLFARHRLSELGRRWVFATEYAIKLPTGYEAPSGTFRDDVPDRGLADDVALGDGQTDLEAILLFGAVPIDALFFRLDAGFRLRLFGPGQQVIGGVKLGWRASPNVIPYIATDAQHTVTQGEVVGLSFVTSDVDVPAREFTLDRITPTPLRLDRTIIAPGAGLLLTQGDRSLDLSYNVVAWGRNVGQIHTFSISTNFLF